MALRFVSKTAEAYDYPLTIRGIKQGMTVAVMDAPLER